jgi:hypothetical protein
MKFRDQYAAPREAAILLGEVAHVCGWNGLEDLSVLHFETDECIPCWSCAERTPFFLSTRGSDPIFVCSDECAAEAGHPSK